MDPVREAHLRSEVREAGGMTCGHCWRLVCERDTIDRLEKVYECEWCHATVRQTYEYEEKWDEEDFA